MHKGTGKGKGKGTGKVHPTTDHQGPERKYINLLAPEFDI
jgi:hypothetical protein